MPIEPLAASIVLTSSDPNHSSRKADVLIVIALTSWLRANLERPFMALAMGFISMS